MDQLVEGAAPVMFRGPSRVASKALTALNARLDDAPNDPWLFWRPGWRWRWRSWGEVGDQVARGAEVIRRAADSAPRGWGRLVFEPRPEPDTVALGLAIRAAGFDPPSVVAEAVSMGVDGDPPWDVRVEVGEEDAGEARRDAAGAPILVLPPCRSRFERVTPQRPALVVETAADTTERRASPIEPAWATALLRVLEGRDGVGGRGIVAAGPELGSSTFWDLVDATAMTGAGWMLEGDPEIFPAAVAWARPTVLVARGRSLERAVEALAGRRLGRLRWVLIPPVEGGEAGDAAGGVSADTRQRIHELGAELLEGQGWGEDGR